MTPPTITPAELMARYRVILVDAYGVLVDHQGALPGAVELIDALARRAHPFFVVTNDASRRPGPMAARFRSLGLAIDADQIVSSGTLLPDYFAAEGLKGARCLVLGTDDSRQLVRDAGGELAPLDDDAEADAIIVCDEDGYAFLAGLDAALTVMFRAFDRGRPLRLLLPNPDLVFPRGTDAYGIASGSIALVLEAALAQRYGADAPRFVRLGKPHPEIFATAERRAGTREMVMLGDQLATDIKGAHDFGIDSVLVGTGLAQVHGEVAPTYRMSGLRILPPPATSNTVQRQ